MKRLFHPDREAISLSDVLYALSDPIRLHIAQSLAASGDCACGTVGIDIAKSKMSYHLRVLREAGVIHQRSEGTHRFNCLRSEDLDARFPGLLDAVLGAGAAMPVREQTQPLQGDITLAHVQ